MMAENQCREVTNTKNKDEPTLSGIMKSHYQITKSIKTIKS